MSPVQTGTIETSVPARLDRLPWSRFHWLVVAGLGTVWILDGLEVTIVGSVASRMTEKGSGIDITAAGIGAAAAFYVAGACLGALFFGQLTDRFGRKKLFLITLGLYIAATGATAFAFAPWYFFLTRFFTGAGIGGEYAAINSAIDELIPARVRGRVDLLINGSFWVGSAAGSALAIVLLNTAWLPKDIGWRVAFGIGVVLGLGVLLVRRHVPESPRWLFIHGREDEAEAIIDSIEQDVEEETGQALPEPDETIEVRQREVIPFREIARVAFRKYPKRSVLALSLFVGQAFIYNGVTFNLGTLFSTFYGVSSSFVPVFVIVFAVSNFLGPLILGRLFDTLGRKPMISGTYIGSAAVAAVTASEIFPMETRALAIAFFYAVGTAVGGITGPLLFGRLISSGQRGHVAIAFWIGAAVMALGGIVELLWGVRAEQESLEDIAKPLTVEDAEGAEGDERGAARATADERRFALDERARADEERAWAAEHRANAIQLRADGNGGAERAETEEVFAAAADERALMNEALAEAHDERAAADAAEGAERAAALDRAAAAVERAWAHRERAESYFAGDARESGRHAEHAEAAFEHARARSQRAEAAEAGGQAGELDGAEAERERARARVHEAWERLHVSRAQLHEGRAADAPDAGELEQEAAAAEARQDEERDVSDTLRRDEERRRRQQRIRDRIARREERERVGLQRFRPGPGTSFYSPGMLGTAFSSRPLEAEEALDREIEALGRALAEHGEVPRSELARLVGARYWGPGRFAAALRAAEQEGSIRRLSRSTYAPASET